MSSRKSIAGVYSSKGTLLMSLSSSLNQHYRYIDLYSNIPTTTYFTSTNYILHEETEKHHKKQTKIPLLHKVQPKHL